MKERDSRLAGLSVTGDLMSLVSSYVSEQRRSVPAVMSRERGVRRLTFDEWWSLLDSVCDGLGSSSIGVDLAQRVGPEHVGVIGYLTLSCQTVLEAFQYFERFQTLLYEGPKARLELRDGLAGLVWDTSFGGSSRISDQVILGGFVTFLRRMTGQSELTIERAETWWDNVPASDLFERHLGGILVCGASANALWFDANVLTLPLVSHDDVAFRALNDKATAALANMPDLGRFADTVRQLIIERLPLGEADQSAIASRLAMSERTLLRRLRQSGIGFRDLLGQVRVELAQVYLRDQHLTLSEIALLLGYSEQAPFNRAFRKATGKTPGKWRAEFILT
ncbi:MAG: helix-turn-helix domain-containing protein [Pseudomonadota bacterium]|nr:helix-turn-helix domain-containing protein [Pseudomonadota bacterium]